MRNAEFSNVSHFINSISFPKQSCDNASFVKLGQGYDEDDNTFVFERLISKKIRIDENNKTHAKLKNGQPASYKLTNSITPADKLNLFVLIAQYYFNQKTQQIFAGYESRLQSLSNTLGITGLAVKEILTFFSNNLPYTDKSTALYLSGKNSNQLVKSGGANIHFILKDNEEIIYLKYIRDYNLFLIKSFYSGKRANAILETVQVRDMNILSKYNFTSIIKELTFDKAFQLLRNFNPFSSIYVKATDITPEITLDADESRIIISGDSMPLSPTNYFEPVFEWLDNYSKYGKNNLDLIIHLNVYNTYTTRFIYKLITVCHNLEKKGRNVTITWCHPPDDEDLIEFGNQLQSLLKAKFKFCSNEKLPEFGL